MKVKHSVIPFIPAALVMIGLKLISLFGLDSNGLFLGMNTTAINYLVIEIGIGLFVLCVLFNIIDRKTAPVYAVKKNVAAGLLSMLSGVAVIASSVVSLLKTTPENSDYYFMSMIVAAFSIPAAIAFVLMSKVHFVGKSTVSGVSMLYIFPALWGCCGLVSEFLAATKVSISASDMTPLFCYIFITLYFFSHAMIVSRIKGRNPVKACFIYGLPAIAVSLSYGIYVILTSIREGAGIENNLVGVQFIVLAAYALSFILEMFSGTLTKSEVEIVENLNDEETYENSYIKSGSYDEVLISQRGREYEEKNIEADDPNTVPPVLSGLDDFVIGYHEDHSMPVNYSDSSKNMFNDVVLSTNNDNYPDLVEDIIFDKKSDKDDTDNKNNSKSSKSFFGFKSTKKDKQAEQPMDDLKPENEEYSASHKADAALDLEKNTTANTFTDAADNKNELPEIKIEPERNTVDDNRLTEIDRLLQELEGKK